MANISQIKTDTDWQEAAGTINTNFANVSTAIEGLKQNVGQLILVGSSLPAPVYRWNGSSFASAGFSAGSASVPLANYLTYESLGTVDD